jgi:hypothetical protein
MLRPLLGALILVSLTPLASSSNNFADPTQKPTANPTPKPTEPVCGKWPIKKGDPISYACVKCRDTVEESIKKQGEGGAINGYEWQSCPMEVCKNALGMPMEDTETKNVYVKGSCKPEAIMKCEVQPATNAGFNGAITKRCVVRKLSPSSELFTLLGLVFSVLLCCCCCRRCQHSTANTYEQTFCCCAKDPYKKLDSEEMFDKHAMDGETTTSPLLGTVSADEDDLSGSEDGKDSFLDEDDDDSDEEEV